MQIESVSREVVNNGMVSADIVLSVIVALGMLQMAWFSVMLVRRGATPLVIQQTIPAFLTVWVLMWPVYIDQRWLAVDLCVLFILLLLSCWLKKDFWQHLRIAWGTQKLEIEWLPQLHFFIALCMAAVWFQYIPAVGFAMGLSLCVAFPAAHWLDLLSKRYGFLLLALSIHPKQSLLGHVVFVGVCITLLCWSLHVYDGAEWQSYINVVLLASIAASLCRACVPNRWNMPVAVVMMGVLLAGVG